MGAITEGVVAGLQLRQRRQEFAASQKQQADQFATQLAMRQREMDAEEANRSVQLFNSLNVMRDRIAGDLPTYAQKLSEVDQQIAPLMTQLDALSVLSPDKTAGLRSHLETLQATRGAYAQAASEAQAQKLSIDKALLGLSMKLGGTAQQQPAADQPSGSSAAPAPAAQEPATSAAPTDAAAPATASAPTQAALPAADDLGLHAQILKRQTGIEPQVGGNGLTFTANYPGEAKLLQEKADTYAKWLGPNAPPIHIVDRWELLKDAPQRLEAQQRLYSSAIGDVGEIDALLAKPDSDEMIRTAAQTAAATGQSEKARNFALALTAKDAERKAIFDRMRKEAVKLQADREEELKRAKAVADEYYNLMGVSQALGTKPPPPQATEDPYTKALRQWRDSGKPVDKEGLKQFNDWYKKNGGK